MNKTNPNNFDEKAQRFLKGIISLYAHLETYLFLLFAEKKEIDHQNLNADIILQRFEQEIIKSKNLPFSQLNYEELQSRTAKLFLFTPLLQDRLIFVLDNLEGLMYGLETSEEQNNE